MKITSGRRSGKNEGRGLLERLLFSFMGPPQLGEHRAPDGFEVEAARSRCQKCGLSWDDHERIHTDSMTYIRCPTAV